MKHPRLSRFLSKHRLIGIDTNVFIYWLDKSSPYHQFVLPIFSWIEEARSRAVVSALAMTEILVAPYRNSDMDQVNRLYGLLNTFPNLEWSPLSLEIADQAAVIRSYYNMRTPDAIHAATAIHHKATGFISNDNQFERVTALDVLRCE